jgi:hypothetical protein
MGQLESHRGIYRQLLSKDSAKGLLARSSFATSAEHRKTEELREGWLVSPFVAGRKILSRWNPPWFGVAILIPTLGIGTGGLSAYFVLSRIDPPSVNALQILVKWEEKSD